MSDALERELLGLAEAIAREAGGLLQRYAAEGFAVGTKSSRTDMVTEADRAAEALIVERIGSARPDDAVMGEEGARREGHTGVRWVVDPLDGTTNFIYGVPAYGVSIGVERDGQVVAGVVFDAAHGEAFTALLGSGAWRDGRPIRASGKAELATALIGTGFGYDAAQRALQGAMLTRLIGRVRDIRRMGSAALDLAHVACGMLDGYYEYRLNPWDIAAGGLIAREAGARTAGFGGYAFEDGFVVAAAPAVFDALREAVEEAYAATRAG
ncbi:inositol monophosphatase family protein [Tepidiforma sp.]|uniref:inositol monophosphatase family protein n=1 Tax=Tepidiforma sp. TaxID=2682230 RepID=UPI002ADD9F8C|nr:inositol monophosphatase family protein [Tepidiforma sp.]